MPALPSADPLQLSTRMVHALQRNLAARLLETHISWVLLTDTDAWKLKKPVHLPFLDASQPETRRLLCEAECSLNRRLAPTLYLGVAAITGSWDEPSLNGSGPVLDHALHMRRFPDASLWSHRVAAHTLCAHEVDALAHRLAAFHHDAARAPATSPWGTPALRARTQADTAIQLLQQTRPGTPARADAQAVCHWLDAEAARLHAFWQQRRAEGQIREGHGDLHLSNLITLPDGDVTAFDCIEFDAALRWIDPMSDIAFAVMDLLAHGRADAGWRLLNAWLDETGDHAGVPGLRAELVHRAAVRALVARLQAPHAPQGPDYLALARQLTQPPAPTLTITHGLSGSGKSQASLRLLQATGAIRLRADVERKRLFGLTALAVSAKHVENGIYTPEAGQRTYATLLQKAEALLGAGWPVILDAAFLKRSQRQEAHDLAARLGVRFGILHCEAPPEVLRARVAQRAAAGTDPSEATLAVLADQHSWDEPLDTSEQTWVVAQPD